VQRLLTWTTDYLRRSGADTPRLDAEILLAESMRCPRISLYTRFPEPASGEVRARYRELVKRRASRTPVAYLTGRKEFFSLDFIVTPDVLIPRPDTEFLVTGLLDEVRKRTGDSRGPRILDLGTGSGVLAICAAKHIPDATITAVDLSPEALDVARRNAEKHQVTDRISFLESDLFTAIPANEQFDFILSNPPYVTRAEWEQLAPEIRNHEPKLALIAGEDGMSVCRRLLAEAPGRLTDGGVCLIETSPMLAATLESAIDAMEPMGVERIPTIHDLARNPRVAGFRKRTS
ncbi:MAG: peptide chain release factor N(5)-glutamine methyltransferase, partial [Planctomycetia bacterium]|nr:peptide chain release factor N(5)-glutamine methyltransferase [Planctomycetia bacterium]